MRLFGVALALVLFAMPYEYCMSGTGYGFPFAWYHPGHGEWGTYIVDPSKNISDVIDPVSIAASLAVWFIIYGLVTWYVARLRNGNVNKTEVKNYNS